MQHRELCTVHPCRGGLLKWCRVSYQIKNKYWLIYIKTSVIYFLSSWKLENMTNTRNMKLFLLFIEMSSNCKFQKG